MPLFAILLLGACSLYTCGSLIARQNWYLSHPDFTRFENAEAVQVFLDEELKIGHTNAEELTEFLNTLDVQRCISREDEYKPVQTDNVTLTRIGTTCWVRAPKPDFSHIEWYNRPFYEAQHWYYILQFTTIDGILSSIGAFFEDSYD